MTKIKHIWFDLDGTLTIHTPEFHKAHNDLRYKTYSEAVKKPLTQKLEQEYEMLYKKYGSNSAVFRSMGFPSDHWMKYFNALNEEEFYKPEEKVYKTLEKLKNIVPISAFTNVKLEKFLRTLTTEILYVGDRVSTDILPAKAVGIKTCLVWSKSDEADYSFDNFEDILTIFNK